MTLCLHRLCALDVFAGWRRTAHPGWNATANARSASGIWGHRPCPCSLRTPPAFPSRFRWRYIVRVDGTPKRIHPLRAETVRLRPGERFHHRSRASSLAVATYCPSAEGHHTYPALMFEPQISCRVRDHHCAVCPHYPSPGTARGAEGHRKDFILVADPRDLRRCSHSHVDRFICTAVAGIVPD